MPRPNPLESLKALGDQLQAQLGEGRFRRARKQDPARPLEEVLAELDALPGLETVKEQVRALVAFLQVQARRKEAGCPRRRRRSTSSSSATRAPARRPSRGCWREMYRSVGLLQRGHLVEVDRAGLVGQYVGRPRSRPTRDPKALDGVLFVDEAYSLAREASGSTSAPRRSRCCSSGWRTTAIASS